MMLCWVCADLSFWGAAVILGALAVLASADLLRRAGRGMRHAPR